MRILLIDDDEWIRDSLRLFFDEEGCKLVGLANAEEALQALARETYDIIISDYKLPGMDGLNFFRLTAKSHPTAMKILITAYGSDELFREASKLGVQDMIQKPLTVENIEKSLSTLLAKADTPEAEN